MPKFIFMKTFWSEISHNGTSNLEDPIELQSLILTNRISVIAVIAGLFIGALLGFRQWNEEPILLICISGIFLLIPALIRFHYPNAGRLLLCFVLPVMIIGMSVFSKKIPGEEITETEYFDYRYVLIAASIVPALVFGFSRKGLLTLSILPYFIGFVFFDTIHNLLNVGYYQIEHGLPSYQISKWIATIMFCIITLGILILRRTSDEVHSKNSMLIEELNKANKFQEHQQFIIAEAHNKIQQQNLELSHVNSQLVDKIKLANSELMETNKELIKHNNELQQFSYIVSHNLRGPVASIVGLVGLMEYEGDTKFNPVVENTKKSAKLLDATIRDLGLIVDIRNDIFKIRQKVNVSTLIREIINPFQKEIDQRGIEIRFSLEAELLYTVKPMLVSILHNLISNALKYGALNRQPTVRITTSESEKGFHIAVKDNGIGIDLSKYGGDLFKLYKRFNTHTEGKGIGLYLVKLQVNALGGDVNVTSELNSFTEFQITIPKPDRLDHQILLDEDYAEVFFDAARNMVGLSWKRAVASVDFRAVMSRSLDFMKEYGAAHWYLDTRKRGPLGPDDELWLANSVLPAVFKLGLKRLAVVYAHEIGQNSRSLFERNKEVFKKHNIQIRFTESEVEAYGWLDKTKWKSPTEQHETAS